MSRLFTLLAAPGEIAAHFQADIASTVAVPPETVEGNPGLVVLENGGRRTVKSIGWGFPRRTLEGGLRGEEPQRVGLVADLTNPMWDTMVVDPRYRCLVPLTHFANSDGDPGSKTRTWFSLKHGETERAPLMAWAGFCRNTDDFGPVFAGMTMTANELVMPYNDRMPVLLAPHEYERWLKGSIQDVIGFQFREPMPASALSILYTDDRWRSGKQPKDSPVSASRMALGL